VVELAVVRHGRTEPYRGQPLHPGDVLAFRLTTRRSHLLVLSAEASGRVSVLLADPTGRRSMGVPPGRPVVLPRGVELDDYLGREHLLVLLSDRPLEVARVRRLLRRRLTGAPAARDGGTGAAALRASPGVARGRLDVDAEQLWWTLHKVSP
jgi:hypothetical protein